MFMFEWSISKLLLYTLTWKRSSLFDQSFNEDFLEGSGKKGSITTRTSVCLIPENVLAYSAKSFNDD
jgi:hypothetical protein